MISKPIRNAVLAGLAGSLLLAVAACGRADAGPREMTPDEWRYKSAQPDTFAARLRDRPRLFVLGDEDDLR